MDLALKMADWAGFAKRKAELKKNGKLRGLGMSNTIERAAAAELRGRRNPLRPRRHGADFLRQHQPGPGPRDDVQAGGGRQARRASGRHRVHPGRHRQGVLRRRHRRLALGHHVGLGVLQAGEKVIAKAKAIAAHNLKVDVADINFNEGIFSSTKTNQTTTIKDVAQDAFNPAKLPKDMEAGLFATAVYKADVENFPNGVHICEVEVDPETGKTDVVKYNVVDDVGTVMNPLLLKGQIVGGVAMGVGQILKEDINFDAGGQLTTGSFMDYAMPRAHDFCAVEVKANPVPTKTNPLGVKGAGEAGCVGAMPAVANALVNALAEFGVKHIEMPATPERVWRRSTTARRDNNMQMTHAEIKEKMIWAGKVLVNEGQDDFTRGHISVRLPDNPSLFFMKCHSVGLDEITAENILTIDLEGKVVAGTSRRHSEVYIHSEIFKVRPDVHCILHTHPLYSIVWSGGGRPLKAISQPAALFHNAVGIYTDTINLIRSHEMGAGVAEALGPHSVVMLKNHGIVTAAPTVEEVVIRTIMFENAAQIQLIAEAAGDIAPEFPR